MKLKTLELRSKHMYVTNEAFLCDNAYNTIDECVQDSVSGLIIYSYDWITFEEMIKETNIENIINI